MLGTTITIFNNRKKSTVSERLFVGNVPYI
jgi:hypothetical protein